MKIAEKLAEIRKIIFEKAEKFLDVKDEAGNLYRLPDTGLEVGVEIQQIAEDGTLTPAPDGEYVIEGTKVKVVEGKVAEIMGDVPTEAEAEVVEASEESDFISSCIKELMDSGETTDQEQASAICYSKWDEKQKASVEKPEEMVDEVIPTEETPEAEVEEPEVEDERIMALEERVANLENAINELLNLMQQTMGKVEEFGATPAAPAVTAKAKNIFIEESKDEKSKFSASGNEWAKKINRNRQ